jgi:alanyl-tRNA synthetase
MSMLSFIFLNFVSSRQTLGNDVDQKGSLVSDEKFRFDFSLNRGVQPDELQTIESIVNGVIDAQLDVSSEVVPLQDALAINGLRAVFGEVYPDPVRVISVGPKVRDDNMIIRRYDTIRMPRRNRKYLLAPRHK